MEAFFIFMTNRICETSVRAFLPEKASFANAKMTDINLRKK